MTNETPGNGLISAFEFDLLRNAFRTSVDQGMIMEAQWMQHARALVRELTGHDNHDEEIFSRIIAK